MLDPAPSIDVEPGRVLELIAAYEYAADEVIEIASDILRRGRIEQQWASDQISLGIAAHYNSAVIDSPASTYSAILQYEQELRNVVRTLRQSLAQYDSAESDATNALN